MKKVILAVVLFACFVIVGFAEEKAVVPVLMYHSVDETNGRYSVTPAKLDEDMKALKSAGYTPVFFDDVIDFVYNAAQLPEKPVIITFDDGYMNNYTSAYPIIKNNDMKAEIFGVCGSIEYSEGFLNPDMALEMEKSGYINFECHTYNLHNDVNKVRVGIGRLENESFRQWEHIFRQDLLFAKQFSTYKLKKAYKAFSYPFGNFSADAEKILKEEGYLVSVTTEQGINEIERNNPESLRLLMRISMDNSSVTAVEAINKFSSGLQSEKISQVKNINIPDYSTRAEAIEVILGDASEKEVKLSFIDGYQDIKLCESKTKKLMELAIEEYLISGYSDLSLRPNHYVTRGEFALMLARHCRFKETPVKSNFTDVSDWCCAAVEFVNEKGYMIGYGETFGVDDFLTKEQLLIIKSRLNN